MNNSSCNGSSLSLGSKQLKGFRETLELSDKLSYLERMLSNLWNCLQLCRVLQASSAGVSFAGAAVRVTTPASNPSPTCAGMHITPVKLIGSPNWTSVARVLGSGFLSG